MVSIVDKSIIALVAPSGHAINIVECVSGTAIAAQNEGEPSNNAKFEVWAGEGQFEGKIALRPIMIEGQVWLSALPEGGLKGEAPHLREWEFFEVEQLGDNKVALKGFHGLYVSAANNGGGEVNCGAQAAGESETFVWTLVAEHL